MWDGTGQRKSVTVGECMTTMPTSTPSVSNPMLHAAGGVMTPSVITIDHSNQNKNTTVSGDAITTSNEPLSGPFQLSPFGVLVKVIVWKDDYYPRFAEGKIKVGQWVKLKVKKSNVNPSTLHRQILFLITGLLLPPLPLLLQLIIRE